MTTLLGRKLLNHHIFSLKLSRDCYIVYCPQLGFISLVVTHFSLPKYLKFSYFISNLQYTWFIIFFQVVFIEIQLIYNVVLVSSKNSTVIQLYIYLFFFRFLLYVIAKYWILFSVLYCRSFLVIYYIQQCVYVNPKLLIYPSLPFPLW